MGDLLLEPFAWDSEMQAAWNGSGVLPSRLGGREGRRRLGFRPKEATFSMTFDDFAHDF